MTYDEAITFWFGRINYEVRSAGPSDLKLERMRALLRMLQDPQQRLRIVHVTGTKGKGSTSAMLAEVLQSAGYRVGLFTSPHLVHVEERIQLNRQSISPDELRAGLERIAPAVRELESGPWPPPTFFEISTALGFLHFAQRRADVAVVEVGLGGRYDSTNVCRPMVSVITSIGYDHMAQLGGTLEAIAYQKAGIIKRNVPCVSGVTQPGPAAVIAAVAKEQDAPLTQAGRDFDFDAEPQAVRYWMLGHEAASQREHYYQLGLPGRHQAANAACVLAALHHIRAAGLSVPEPSVRSALGSVHWPARIECVRRAPLVILDSAHNVPSIEALLETLRESFPVPGRKRLLFAVSSDKQYPAMLNQLSTFFDDMYLTRYGNNPRCVPPGTLRDLLPDDRRSTARIFAAAHDAWEAVLRHAAAEDLICITGSVFLAGELQAAVRAA